MSGLRAERQTGGEVLRAESMQRDGREVYRLKVLTPDGRVSHTTRREGPLSDRVTLAEDAADELRARGGAGFFTS